MALVIGRRATRVPARAAADYILGVTCVNDVTARDMQNRGVQYTHVKGFDTFAPVGPCIAMGLDPVGPRGRGLGERRAAPGVADEPADLLRVASWWPSSRRS